MDAHVFRRCCDVLVPLLTGARLEKIQSPAPDVHVFTVFMQGRKQQLYLRAGRQQPFLFLSAEKSSTGAPPSAPVMRLRKFVGGRRIAACSPDWAGRRLSLLCGPVLEGLHKGEECWLVLDLREGPFLWMGRTCCALEGEVPAGAAAEAATAIPSGISVKAGAGDIAASAAEPAAVAEGEGSVTAPAQGAEREAPACPVLPAPVRWPAPEYLDEACAQWRNWPVLTPALRRTLPHLDALDRQALLVDLEYGGGDIYTYTAENGGTELSAWPLPAAQRKGRREAVREDVLPAVAEAAAAQVLGDLTRAARAHAAAPLEREAARLGRILEKQLAEEARLTAMCAAQQDALALQAVLWCCPQDMRGVALDVPPESGLENAGGQHAAESARGEMLKNAAGRQLAAGAAGGQKIANAADRACAAGRQGMTDGQTLADAAGEQCAADGVEGFPRVPVAGSDGTLPPVPAGWRRLKLDPRLSLRENMEALFHKAKRGKRGLAFVAERRALVQQAQQAAQDAAARARMGLTPALAPRKAAAPEAGTVLARALPKGVQGFVSSDGFAVLRGRDVKGNLAVLRLASPHDIWLHVEGGPGSHAVIRRGFAGQEIPERTLLEAGALVLCKSWQKDNDRATVLYAEARHIKPMRNAAPGMVRIDKVFTTRVVPADAEAERRLALPE